MSKHDPIALRQYFPDAPQSRWQELATAALKGGDPNALKRDLGQGLKKKPIYFTQEPAGQAMGWPDQTPWIRGGRALDRRQAGWDVRVACIPGHTQLSELTDGLSEAARSVWIGPGWFPIANPLDAKLDVQTYLQHLDLSATPVAFDAIDGLQAAWEVIHEAATTQGVKTSLLTGVIRADPAEHLVRSGTIKTPIEEHNDQLASLLKAKSTPWIHLINGSGLTTQSAGASAPLGVATAISSALQCWRAMHQRGVSLNQAVQRTELTLATYGDQFVTIATLRAARWVFAKTCVAVGAKASAAFIHAVTGITSSTRRGAELNMLRGTNEAAAAAMGGADAITLTPYDAATGEFAAHPARVARNAQLLLAQEAHLARVIDPAGGSGYVESLTEQIARSAWTYLQQFERQGGPLAMLKSGSLAPLVAESKSKEESAIAHRAQTVVGVNDFAHVEDVVDVPAATSASQSSLARWTRSAAWEAVSAQCGSLQGQVLSVNMGPKRRHAARANFARRYLESIAIKVTDAQASTTPKTLAKQYRRMSKPIGVVICGHQQDYDERLEALAKAAKRAGAQFVLLAGRVPEDIEAPTLTACCHMGMDGLELAQRLFEACAEEAGR